MMILCTLPSRHPVIAITYKSRAPTERPCLRGRSCGKEASHLGHGWVTAGLFLHDSQSQRTISMPCDWAKAGTWMMGGTATLLFCGHLFNG